MNSTLKLTILFVCFVSLLSGCLSYNENSPAYTVKHVFYDPYDTYMLSLFDDNIDKISLTRFVERKSGESWYAMSMTYTGEDWRYMDGKVIIKINDEIIEYRNEQPSRGVLHDGSVYEIVSVTVDASFTDRIRSLKTMRIQFHHDPITISRRGITNIKKFFNEMEGKQ